MLRRDAVFSLAPAGGSGVLGACGVSTTGGGGLSRKEDAKFRDAFNKKLNELKESGEILSAVGPFGFTETEVDAAEKVTTEELCKG